MAEALRCDAPSDADESQLYHLLISELTDFAVFLMDPNGCVVSWNPGVEHLLGYTEGEWLGRPVEIIFTSEDRASGKPEEELLIAMRDGRAPDVRWHQKKDGSRLFVEGTMVALRDEGGKLLGFSKVMRDITERKEAEAERERLVAELARSNDDLSQFARIASHDLRAPLSTITQFLQLLLRKYKGRVLDESAELYIGLINDNTQRMSALTSDLLRLSEVSSDSSAVIAAPVEVDRTVKTALANLQAVIEESGAVVSWGSLPQVSMEETLLVQLFQNLIANAVKYRSKEEPRVRIEVKNHGDAYMFSVQDNGIGIEKKYQEQIFAPFKRLHGAEISGSGIGLAVCKKIVERAGGRIWVDSEPGGGSTFLFTLPRR